MNLEEMLKKKMFEGLGLRVEVAAAETPLPPEALTDMEKRKIATFSSSERKADWLMGRAALKRLLEKLGMPEDRPLIHFPNAQVSLSHTEGLALAVGTRAKNVSGLGVDVQNDRAIRPHAADFFLGKEERAWIKASNRTLENKTLLRLWTIKEALFKANPRNRGTRLLQYTVLHPSEPSGIAFAPGHGGIPFSYASFELANRFFAAACF